MPEPSPPRRRCLLALGLRGLMILVLVIGGAIGWVVSRAREQREIAEAIVEAGGNYSYDHELQERAERFNYRRRTPTWLDKTLGPDYFRTITHVILRNDPMGNKQVWADDALMARIGRLRHLTTLTVDGNPGVTGAGLAELRGLRRVRWLDLSHTGIDGPSLVHLRGLTGLEHLSLPDDVSDADLAHVAGLTSLTGLGISGPRITNAGLAHLARLTSLDMLSIECPGIKGPGLAPLKGMTKVGDLFLDGSGIDSLASLPPLPHLSNLSLRRLPIDDADLARVAGLTSLQELDLAWTAVSDAGLAHLAGLARLQYLDLCGTKVSDAALPHLQALPQGIKIDLGGTAVTPAGLAAFKAAMPGRRVLP